MDINVVLDRKENKLRVPFVSSTLVTEMPDVGAQEANFSRFETELKCALHLCLAQEEPENHLNGFYALSDKAMKEDEFIQMLKCTWGPQLIRYSRIANQHKGTSLALNPEMRMSKFNSLLGSIFWTIYLIDDATASSLSANKRTTLQTFSTELYYTYKEGKFVLLSYVTAFAQDM